MLATEPVDLLLNVVTGDLVITTDLSLSSGFPAVVQSARIAMATFAGEWFMNLDAGVPYFERSGIPAAKALFAQKYNQGRAVAAFRTALAAVHGVTSINRLDVAFNASTRAMAVTWQARTVFGDTPVDTLALGV